MKLLRSRAIRILRTARNTNDEPEDGSRRAGTKRTGSATDNTEWSFPEEENEAPSSAISARRDIDEKPVTWRSLPRKDQLVVLTLARLSEPLTQTSLSAHMFYQLKSFDTSLPDSTIASQGGILQASFPAAQFITAVLWGRAADMDWTGRKRVLLIGLFGTCLSCLGFGFATSFKQAMFFRIIGGAVNGNIGVMRTMISEIIKEKKYDDLPASRTSQADTEQISITRVSDSSDVLQYRSYDRSHIRRISS
jgi:hypothetical protein